MKDLKTLLPDKLGPRIKIWALIQTLHNEQALIEANRIKLINKSIDACSETSTPKAVSNEPQIHSANNCFSIASPPETTSSCKLLSSISQPRVVNDELQINVRDDTSSTAEPSSSSWDVFPSTPEEQKPSSSFNSNGISVTPSELQPVKYYNVPDLTKDQGDFSTSMENVETKTNYSAMTQIASKALSYVLENPAEVYDSFLKPFLKPSGSECKDHSFIEPISIDDQVTHSSTPETSIYLDRTNIEGKQRKSFSSEKEEPRDRPYNYKKEKETNQSTEPKSKQKSHVGRKYGRPSSDRVPIPHKIIDSKKKLPIYEYKNELLNVSQQRHPFYLKTCQLTVSLFSDRKSEFCSNCHR